MSCVIYTCQNKYEHGYNLGDEIDPKYSTITKTCPNPVTPKHVNFSKMQKGQMEDVKRTFEVIQSRFAMISIPCRL